MEAVTARFVVQQHHASHLHWDFRLELDGALKSWAVPKGIPLEVGVKRLAVQVEDHAADYIDFEGEIAEGQYGAGKVLIWDSGAFTLHERADGRYVFTLEGGKAKGRYALVRLKDAKNWLLFRTKEA
jgi:bifunctional non-homologous end joining protein LigD